MPTAHSTSAKTQQADTRSKSTKQSTTKQTSVPRTTLETGDEQSNQVEQVLNVVTGAGVKTPPEQPEFIKQALVIIEKKVRNLEKRRQKLEEYREMQRKGTVLNEDQLLAVSKHEEVLRSLELSRELEKQFIGLANDALKQQKKQTKKEQLEREEQVRERVKESQKYLSVLDTFGDDVVRNDFLNELNGAFKMSETEMKLLDDFNKLVKPAELGAKLDQMTAEIADHLTSLIDSKNKPIQSMNVTYSELRKLFDRLMTASYWTREPQQQQQEAPVTQLNEPTLEQPTPIEQQTNELHETQSKPVQLVDQVQVTHDEHQQSGPIEQTLYHQQNTSDDYVLVSTNDINENNQSKSPNQQAQAKTFFTTLNAADLPAHRNINEFLNRCENSDDGINFLQDSEIQQRQQQQQEHLQQQNEHGYQQSGNNYNYNQDPNLPEGQKDNQYKQRGGNQNGAPSNGQRPYQQRPRYSDDRRMGGSQGGMPRNNGNAGGPPQQRNNNSAPNNANQTSFNNGPRNPNGGGYRGGANTGSRGGYYRGAQNNSNNQGGFRNSNNNGPRGYQQQPPQRMNNNHENVHDNQQPQMA